MVVFAMLKFLARLFVDYLKSLIMPMHIHCTRSGTGTFQYRPLGISALLDRPRLQKTPVSQLYQPRATQDEGLPHAQGDLPP